MILEDKAKLRQVYSRQEPSDPMCADIYYVNALKDTFKAHRDKIEHLLPLLRFKLSYRHGAWPIALRAVGSITMPVSFHDNALRQSKDVACLLTN